MCKMRRRSEREISRQRVDNEESFLLVGGGGFSAVTSVTGGALDESSISATITLLLFLLLACSDHFTLQQLFNPPISSIFRSPRLSLVEERERAVSIQAETFN